MSLNLTAHGAQQIGGFTSAIPYYILIALVALTGWYQVRQTQARQLQSGSTPPNAQMQAMTKVFPVFFAFICFGLNAGATLYFVVSNIWRIGQQHLVLGKLYEQGVASGDIKPAVEPEAKGSNGKAVDAGADGKSGNGKSGNGKGTPGAKPSGAKSPENKSPNGNNGNAGQGNAGQGNGGQPKSPSSGARRKKRKR